jgi:hypothetical protein
MMADQMVARLKAEYQLQELLNPCGEGKAMTLTRNSYNDMAFRRFAHECAKHKLYGTCSSICRSCGLNISAYSIPPEDAVIMQQMAELDVGETDARRRQVAAEHYAEAGVERVAVHVRLCTWAIVIAVCVFLATQYRSCTAEAKNDQVTQTTARSVPMVETPVVATVRKQAAVDVLISIRSTLNRVTKQRDMNGDGKVTCIDYTLMFYDAYPNKNNVRIVWNKNMTANMNHLFVKVWVNGEWMPVEPQAYVSPVTDRWFSMRKYWGTKYSPDYDLDVTAHIENIRQSTFVWSR